MWVQGGEEGGRRRGADAGSTQRILQVFVRVVTIMFMLLECGIEVFESD